MLPIDPDKRDDIYYRYKMPAVQTKVEGSGNGIKTVIPNIHEICVAINRPEEVLMKFFQFELGAQRTVSTKDDKFLLMGAHSTERMQDKIYDFVRKFVLCKSCRNPETAVELEVSKKGVPSITMVCGACGKRSKFDDHRVLAVMTQHYHKNPEQAKAAKGAAEARRKEEDASAAASAAAAASAPSGPAKPAKDAGQSDLKDNREDPMTVLSREMKECGDRDEELIGRIVRLMSQYNLTELYGPPLLLSTLVRDHEKDLLSSMKRYAYVLKRFATVPELFSRTDTVDEKELTELLAREQKIQKVFLKECERLCADVYTVDKMPVMVFMLFVEGVVRDTSIAAWQKEPKPHRSTKNQAVVAEMKAKVAPIVEWLGLNEPAEPETVPSPAPAGSSHKASPAPAAA